MSTEHLTPEEQALENARVLHVVGGFVLKPIIEAMKAHSASQVEQQTKQLREERQTALNLLAQCDAYQLPEWLADKIQAFFHQLNQNNEGANHQDPF